MVDEAWKKIFPSFFFKDITCVCKPVLIDPKQIEKNLIYENYVKKTIIVK